MRSYVMKLILEFCKKNDTPVSDEDYKNVSISESRQEKWDLVEQCFAEVWKRNAMRAYVYLLKRYEDLPSASIAKVLGTTGNNIDQYFARANNDMLQLLSEQGGRQ
jgi:DNA-directed RNA polymerase specialized sigma24 family protein